MTKQLYYDDPLIAVYMLREFGVNYRVLYRDSLIEEDESGLRHDIYWATNSKYIISPDSLDIFKPQVGDLCRKSTQPSCYYCGMDVLLYIKDNEDLDLWRDDIVEIIQRNGKQFFMPKEA